MITITVPFDNPLNQKTYENLINTLQFHQLQCTCGHSGCLTIHGYYPRSLKENDSEITLSICRVKCSHCGKTLDCQHFFRQIFLGYFSDIVQAFDTLRKNVCGDDYTSLHNPIVLSSVLPAYGMFHSIQILFL